jgi:hypothetical protein
MDLIKLISDDEDEEKSRLEDVDEHKKIKEAKHLWFLEGQFDFELNDVLFLPNRGPFDLFDSQSAITVSSVLLSGWERSKSMLRMFLVVTLLLWLVWISSSRRMQPLQARRKLMPAQSEQ